jgi:uncharacterized protein (TIGR02996 family)
MTDRDAFLRAIIDRPEDDTARLVFADWLEEHGEAARGEFIRIEVQLARRDPDDEAAEARRRDLFARRDELLRAHKREWLEPFHGYATESSFERGFVQELAVPAHAFLTQGERWAALTPITRVRITTCLDADGSDGRRVWWAGGLLSSPLLSRLERIDLERAGLNADDVERLSWQPDLPRLRELVLDWNDIGTAGAITLAGMPQLRGLEVLDLVGNGISDRGARAVAQSSYLGGLKELRMSRNPIRKKSWTMLELRFGTALVG